MITMNFARHCTAQWIDENGEIVRAVDEKDFADRYAPQGEPIGYIEADASERYGASWATRIYSHSAATHTVPVYGSPASCPKCAELERRLDAALTARKEAITRADNAQADMVKEQGRADDNQRMLVEAVEARRAETKRAEAAEKSLAEARKELDEAAKAHGRQHQMIFKIATERDVARKALEAHRAFVATYDVCSSVGQLKYARDKLRSALPPDAARGECGCGGSDKTGHMPECDMHPKREDIAKPPPALPPAVQRALKVALKVNEELKHVDVCARGPLALELDRALHLRLADLKADMGMPAQTVTGKLPGWSFAAAPRQMVYANSETLRELIEAGQRSKLKEGAMTGVLLSTTPGGRFDTALGVLPIDPANTFRCAGCGLVWPNSHGAGDDHPDLCDPCANWEHEEKRALSLRSTLIDVGRAIGASLSDSVSDGFLQGLVGEATTCQTTIEQLRVRCVELSKKANDRLDAQKKEAKADRDIAQTALQECIKERDEAVKGSNHLGRIEEKARQLGWDPREGDLLGWMFAKQQLVEVLRARETYLTSLEQDALKLGWNRLSAGSLGEWMQNQCDQVRSLEQQLNGSRADVVAAAGELLLPIPEPGTNMAKVMIANRLLHHENEKYWEVVRLSQKIVCGPLITVTPCDSNTPEQDQWYDDWVKATVRSEKEGAS